jgi:hemin uptake protein HemP
MSAGPHDPSDNPDKKSGAAPIGRSVSLMDNRIRSRDLFAATREILIIHGDETYRLRLTAQNKLILTK